MSRNSLFIFAFFTTVALCMPQHTSAQSMGIPFRQEGLASWYGPEFDGRPTASGEIFNSNLLTAAHPSLPFGTLLTVINKQNNRRVIVKVNDRGPFVQGRIIDLSKAAAESIDMLADGTVPVLIETTPPTYSQPTEPPAPSPITVTSAVPAPGPGFGPEPSVMIPSSPMEQPNSYPYPPVTVNVYSTPQPQSQPEFETVPVQPQFDPYAQPWLQSMSQPYAPPPYDYQPEIAAPPPPPPVYAPPPPPPPAYAPPPPPVYAPPPPPPVYAPPPPPPMYAPPPPPLEIAPPPLPPAPGLKLLPAITPLPGRVYRLQIGSYKVPRHAVDAFDKLKAAGLNPSYEPNGEYYRVVLARVPGTEVPSVVAKLEYAGFREALIKEER